MDRAARVKRPPPAVVTAVGVGVALIGAAVVVGIVSGDSRLAAAVAAFGGVLIGVGLVSWGRTSHHDQDHEPREVKGPRFGRRTTLAAAATATVAVGVAVVPTISRLGDATRRLRSTAWTAGTPVVDATGERVALGSIDVGDLVNVYPRGWVGDPDSQAIVIRTDPARLAPSVDGPLAVEFGVVAYSKLCTHMACPLGLYEQQSGTLLCPCHQALFDVLANGRVLRGPADRPLPRLPLGVEADGLLVARGDFTDAVGTGFWGRP
jgi:ubiquinol-cytochrome c reductase iron-sulfur subunit